MSANRSSSSCTSLKANVLKLSEPAKDLLPGVDVFIFDCDGVIWRVSNIVCLFVKEYGIILYVIQSNMLCLFINCKHITTL